MKRCEKDTGILGLAAHRCNIVEIGTASVA